MHVLIFVTVTKDENAVREFSLVGDGDTTQTQELLGNEFDQIIAPSRQREVEEGRGGGRQEREREGRREREREGRWEREREGRQEEEREGMRATPGRKVDPGMSVLQDSVLGMTPDGMDTQILYSRKNITKFAVNYVRVVQRRRDMSINS